MLRVLFVYLNFWVIILGGVAFGQDIRCTCCLKIQNDFAQNSCALKTTMSPSGTTRIFFAEGSHNAACDFSAKTHHFIFQKKNGCLFFERRVEGQLVERLKANDLSNFTILDQLLEANFGFENSSSFKTSKLPYLQISFGVNCGRYYLHGIRRTPELLQILPEACGKNNSSAIKEDYFNRLDLQHGAADLYIVITHKNKTDDIIKVTSNEYLKIQGDGVESSWVSALGELKNCNTENNEIRSLGGLGINTQALHLSYIRSLSSIVSASIIHKPGNSSTEEFVNARNYLMETALKCNLPSLAL